MQRNTRVVVPTKASGPQRGTLRYVGPARLGRERASIEIWAGIELDEPWPLPEDHPEALAMGCVLERGDGMVGGMRYFLCREGHAIFMRKDHISIDADADLEVRRNAAVRIQAFARRVAAQKLVRSMLTVHAWNVLDANVENAGIRRGTAVTKARESLRSKTDAAAGRGGGRRDGEPEEVEEDDLEIHEGQTEDQIVERVLKLAEREVAELTVESLNAMKTSASEEEYEGCHLRFPLALDSVLAMMEDFKAGKSIHYRYFMQLMLLAKDLFEAEPNVQEILFSGKGGNDDEDGEKKKDDDVTTAVSDEGKTAEDESRRRREAEAPRTRAGRQSSSSSSATTTTTTSEEQVLHIVGDIHGQLDDLFTIFSIKGVPSPTNMYLFNGDFVDRGSRGVEVLSVLCAFKVLYPKAVFLNRGNHEARAQNAWMGFEEEILYKFCNAASIAPGDKRAALRVHILCEQLFDALPLCAVVQEKVFVCHGGLFRNDGVTLNHLAAIMRKREPPLAGRSFEDRIFEDLLWSDPRPTPSYPRPLTGRRSSDRGAGCEFGPAVTNAFCVANQIALVVRSHECVPEGFEVLHEGRLITLFSASRYCGTQTNKGAFISMKRDLQPEVHQFYAETSSAAFISNDERQRALEEDLIHMIVEQIIEHKLDLYWYFTRNDTKRTGCVTKAEWAAALANVLAMNLPFLHLFHHLVSDDCLVSCGENKQDVSSSSASSPASSKGEATSSSPESSGGDEVEHIVNYSRFLHRFQIRIADADDSFGNAVVARVCEKLFTALQTARERRRAEELEEEEDDDEVEEEEMQQQHDPGASDEIRLRRHKKRHAANLLSAWRRFDVKGDGRIGFAEFLGALKGLDLGLTDAQVYELMRAVDADQDAHIDYREFEGRFGPALEEHLIVRGAQDRRTREKKKSGTTSVATTTTTSAKSDGKTPREKRISLDWKRLDEGLIETIQRVSNAVLTRERDLPSAFQRFFDRRKRGYADLDDFRSGLEEVVSTSPPLEEEEIVRLFKACDSTGSGRLNYVEFVAAFHITDSADDKAWQREVVQQVAGVLYQLRVHITAAFRNYFDLSKNGRVSAADFRTGMIAFNDYLDHPLSVMQIEELTRVLEDANGLVAYRDFFDGLSIVDGGSFRTTSSKLNLLSNLESSSNTFSTNAITTNNTTASGSTLTSKLLMRKSSSFYFQQLERDERLVRTAKANAEKRAGGSGSSRPKTFTARSRLKTSLQSIQSDSDDDDDDVGDAEEVEVI